MEANKVMTAEEMEQSGQYDDYQSMMIAFAQMHVNAALQEAADNVSHFHKVYNKTFLINKKTILNAYPLANIE